MRYHVESRDMSKVEPILAACGVSGCRRIMLEPAETVTLTGNYWDGGCRSYWHFVDLATMRAVTAPTAHPAFDPAGRAGLGAVPITLPAGTIAVEDAHFGTYRDVTLYANAGTLTPMLPAGDTLSEDCAIVLIATASLKNSYGGETDIRFRRASGRVGITRERWDAAQAECIASGHLNKAGAITPRGRNAIEGHPLRHRIS